jgi:REP element-mobilizing transposase RayT
VNVPLAYFITFTTYGTWLHGRASGSVDREHNEPGAPFLPADAEKEYVERGHLRQPEYRLDAERRDIVLRTIVEVAKHRGWTLWAVHVRSNHVHMIVSAPARPEKIMADCKVWVSRRLREAFGEDADRDRWTQDGSTIYLWTSEALAEKIAYVADGQGAPMAVYDSRKTEPEA